MGGFFSALFAKGELAVLAILAAVMGAYGLFQVAMKLLEHHRASQKASIEKLNFTEHFFEKIAGKKVQPLVMERAIHTLTGRTNIKVHELEYLLHLEDIDQKIKQYSRTKPDLWIDETKPLKEQLQFREGLETKKERSKYRRSKNAVYFILAFFGSYTPYVMWTEKWYISVFFSIGMGILFATSIVLAFMQLVLDGRVQDAQKLHKSISEYWANQSD